MPTSRRLLALAVLALIGTAEGGTFRFPVSLPGFTGRPAAAAFTEGGPIATLLKREDTDCSWVGIYEYRDGQAATVGLNQGLTVQHLIPKDDLRTSRTVV